jgi:hypothetical protein
MGITKKKNRRLHFQGRLAFGGFHFGAKECIAGASRSVGTKYPGVDSKFIFYFTFLSLCLACEAVFI